MIALGMEVLLSGVLGIVFLVAAIPKLRHPSGFVLAVLEYRVLPTGLSWFYARLVPPLEFLLALLLLTGTAVRSSAIVASLLLLTFIAAVGINLARGRNLDCNCFGKTRRSIGWGTVFQDVALLCVAVALALMSEWVAAEPWSVFRLCGLVQSSSSPWPSLGCGGLTVCAIVLLNRRIYEKRYGSGEVSK